MNESDKIEIIKNLSQDMDEHDTLELLPIPHDLKIAGYVWLNADDPYDTRIHDALSSYVPIAIRLKKSSAIEQEEKDLTYSDTIRALRVKRKTELLMLFARPANVVEGEKDRTISELKNYIDRREIEIRKDADEGKTASKALEKVTKELIDAKAARITAESWYNETKFQNEKLTSQIDELRKDLQKITQEQGEAWVRKITGRE